jgi:osmotically-inducible protein OsmY
MLRRTISLLGIAAFVVSMAACSQTDPGITTAVKAKLAADDTVKAYKIDVDTKNATVTLTGTVDTSDAKAKAVAIARSTKGVADVVDQLSVSPPAVPTSGVTVPETVTDPAITAALKTSLLADPSVGGLKIDVDTKDSVVTLSGNVATADEKARAEEIAKGTRGVTSVVNQLKIAPKK